MLVPIFINDWFGDPSSPNIVDGVGFTPLMYGAMNGHIAIVKKLIELGADVNFQRAESGDTALHYAAQCGHTRTVEVLILGNADVHWRNVNGKTPFDIAVDFGHGNNKIMKSLFQSDLCDVDSKCNGPDSTKLVDCTETKPNGRIAKDNSLLPCRNLLVILQETGAYMLLQSGLGFTLLAKNGPINQMVEEAAHTLNISLCESCKLIQKLNTIRLDFNNKDSMVEFELNKQQSSKCDTNSNTALRHYFHWKKENQKKIEQMMLHLHHCM